MGEDAALQIVVKFPLHIGGPACVVRAAAAARLLAPRDRVNEHCAK
jgi:hypothetical protein